jgi:tRNA(adenine34) deaminase
LDCKPHDEIIGNDYKWMQSAIEMAHKAESIGEVPVGAVLIRDNAILATGYNSVITSSDPTCHAEINAMRKAGRLLNNYRMPDTTLYVTLEPCLMCMGAIIHARIARLVFGAFDPKTGAAESVYTIGSDTLLNHTLQMRSGILEEECSNMLKAFFKNRREEKKASKSGPA